MSPDPFSYKTHFKNKYNSFHLFSSYQKIHRMKLLNLVIFLIFHITSLHLCVESTDSSHPQDPYSCASASQPPYSCDSSDPSTKTYDFCKTTLPISRRAEDLVSRLTFEEKATQLVDTSPAIPRLGIPAYEWWSEGLHGIGFLTRVQQGISFFNRTIQHATSFPQVILTAASFDAHIWYRIGQVSVCVWDVVKHVSNFFLLIFFLIF